MATFAKYRSRDGQETWINLDQVERIVFEANPPQATAYFASGLTVAIAGESYRRFLSGLFRVLESNKRSPAPLVPDRQPQP